MAPKQRGSEKLRFQCGNTGARAVENIQNIEALLEARGGAGFYLQPWFIRGLPAFLDAESSRRIADPAAFEPPAARF